MPQLSGMAQVSKTMIKAGFEVLQTDSCTWRLVDRSDPAGPRTVGLAAAHVDDFLFAGEANHPKYQEALEVIHQAYSWTPWEIDNYSHCGVKVSQAANGNVYLDHSEFCSSIEAIKL